MESGKRAVRFEKCEVFYGNSGFEYRGIGWSATETGFEMCSVAEGLVIGVAAAAERHHFHLRVNRGPVFVHKGKLAFDDQRTSGTVDDSGFRGLGGGVRY